MPEIAFKNNQDHAVHIGNKMIPPHGTRMVDASMLPDAHQHDDAAAASAAAPDALLDILDNNVGTVADALPGMSDDELDRLEAAEQAGNTRKGVISAIAEERLRRAAADTPAAPADADTPAAPAAAAAADNAG